MIPRIIAGYVGLVALLMALVRVLIGVLLIASVALNLANVVGRYAFHAPIVGAEEIMLFFMIGIVFLGFSRVLWEGKHIKMDIVMNLLPRRYRVFSERVVAVVTLVIAAVIVALATPVVQHLVAFHQLSEASRVPLAIPQAAIPAGFTLMILVVLARFLSPLPASQPDDVHMIRERGEHAG